MALAGLVACFAAVAVFWYPVTTLGETSNDSALTYEMRDLMMALAVLYTTGMVMCVFHALGCLLQATSLGVGLPVLWYLEYSDTLMRLEFGWDLHLRYGVALAGTTLIIASMFVSVEMPSMRLTIPPRSRFHGWPSWGGRAESGPLSRKVKVAVAAVIIASSASVASFTVYATSEEVSRLSVFGLWLFVAPAEAVAVEVHLDGQLVPCDIIVVDGYAAGFRVDWIDVSAGTHKLRVDVTNDLWAPGLDDPVSGEVSVRVLPFTDEALHLWRV